MLSTTHVWMVFHYDADVSDKMYDIKEPPIRPPDKSVYWKTIFFISHPKHILWVLKRTVSMRRFFWAPKTYVLTDG